MSNNEIKVGSRVRHEAGGEGTVVGVTGTRIKVVWDEHRRCNPEYCTSEYDSDPVKEQGVDDIKRITLLPPEDSGDRSRNDQIDPVAARMWPECPITHRPFFMTVLHPERGDVPTFGGPFDSYTIPEADEDGHLHCERYDHDAGHWVEGGEPVPSRLLTWDEEKEMEGRWKCPFCGEEMGYENAVAHIQQRHSDRAPKPASEDSGGDGPLVTCDLSCNFAPRYHQHQGHHSRYAACINPQPVAPDIPRTEPNPDRLGTCSYRLEPHSRYDHFQSCDRPLERKFEPCDEKLNLPGWYVANQPPKCAECGESIVAGQWEGEPPVHLGLRCPTVTPDIPRDGEPGTDKRPCWHCRYGPEPNATIGTDCPICGGTGWLPKRNEMSQTRLESIQRNIMDSGRCGTDRDVVDLLGEVLRLREIVARPDQMPEDFHPERERQDDIEQEADAAAPDPPVDLEAEAWDISDLLSDEEKRQWAGERLVVHLATAQKAVEQERQRGQEAWRVLDKGTKLIIEQLQEEIRLLRGREQLATEVCAMATEPKLELRKAVAEIGRLQESLALAQDEERRLSEMVQQHVITIANLENELLAVDFALARRSALDGLTTRAAKVERACYVAGQAEAAGRIGLETQHQLATAKGQINEQAETIKSLTQAERAQDDEIQRLEKLLAQKHKDLETALPELTRLRHEIPLLIEAHRQLLDAYGDAQMRLELADLKKRVFKQDSTGTKPEGTCSFPNHFAILPHAQTGDCVKWKPNSSGPSPTEG